MQILEIGLRNFQSFGNIRQTIKLNTEKGELILLVGSNGAGKTTIGNNLDFTLYKKVRGKNKKSVTLSNLPNRINKEMVSDVTFIANNNKYFIERGINPNYIKLCENDMPPDDKAGAAIIDDKIVKTIGLDYDTFKTFISMSINDFKNFISLSNEDKKVLLDKMFNLEYINLLNKVLTSITSDNKKDIEILNKEIQTLNNSIYQIENSLKKATEKLYEKIETDHNEQLEILKNDFVTKKQLFDDNKTKLDTGKQKQKELKIKVDSEKTSYIETAEKIKNLNIKLKLYESGKCPTCESSLETDFHSSIKNDLLNQVETLSDIKITLDVNIKKYKEIEDKANNYVNKAIELNSKLNSELNTIKIQRDNILAKMKQVKDVVKNDESLQEFEASIKKLTDNKVEVENKKVVSEDRLTYHKILSTILGENGVKNVIIRNIIFPINTFIQQNAIMLNLPFDIELTENFDAIIRHFGEEINPETLSTGEMRKVNLSIMIAYLKLIRTKININVLFLDEIFSSIDVESINDVIVLLKDFASEYNINIFLVHHSHLDYENFDRVIRINKDVFSTIEDININEI